MKDKFSLFFLVLLNTASALAGNLELLLQKGHHDAIDSLHFNEDGNNLISSDKRHLTILWDFFSHNEIYHSDSFFIPNDFIPAINPKGDYKCSLNQSRKKLIVRKADRKILVIQSELSRFNFIVQSSTIGDFAYCYKNEKYVIIKNINKFHESRILKLPSLPTAIQFHPILKNIIVIGLDNGDIDIFELGTCKLLFALNAALFKTEYVIGGINDRISIKGPSMVFVHTINKNAFKYLQPKVRTKNFDFITDDDSTLNYNLIVNENGVVSKQQNHKKKIIYRDVISEIKNNILSPLVFYSMVLISLQNTIEFIIGDLHFEKKINKNVLTTEDYYWISENNSLKGISKNHIANKHFFVTGNSPILYCANRKFIAAWRAPYNLTIKGINKHSEKFINYSIDISDMAWVGDSDSLVLQVHDHFKIIVIKKEPELISLNIGRYLNSIGGQIYYILNDSLISLNSDFRMRFKLPRNEKALYFRPDFFNGKIFGYIYYENGIIDYVDELGNIIVTIYLFKNGQYLYMTPDNFFMTSSKSLLQKLIMKDSSNLCYPLNQFELKYNRPDVVLERLNLRDTTLLYLYKTAYMENLERNRDITAEFKGDIEPIASIKNWSEDCQTNKEKLYLELSYKSKVDPFRSINISINNVPIWGAHGLDMRGRSLTQLDTSILISLSIGDNNIRLNVTDSSGWKNNERNYYIKSIYNYSPNVYFVGIGMNHYLETTDSLSFACKDVTDLAELFNSKYKSRTITDLLMNDQVTKESVTQSLLKLRNINVNDIVIFSYSGHGLISKNFDFYLATYPVNFNMPQLDGISYELLDSIMEQIPARRKIIFLDACHSGDLFEKLYHSSLNHSLNLDSLHAGIKKSKWHDKEYERQEKAFEMMNEVFSDLHSENGIIMISAARGNEYASESYDLKHGIFSSCLIKGLAQNKADLNGDKNITISELKNYLSDEVVSQSFGHQQPVFRKENNEYDWKIWGGTFDD